MIPVIRRVRGKALPPGAVYIGRPSRWGNPFLVEAWTRAGAIARYSEWIAERKHLVYELAARKPTALACWCAPEACHGDVLAEMLAATGATQQEDE